MLSTIMVYRFVLMWQTYPAWFHRGQKLRIPPPQYHQLEALEATRSKPRELNSPSSNVLHTLIYLHIYCHPLPLPLPNSLNETLPWNHFLLFCFVKDKIACLWSRNKLLDNRTVQSIGPYWEQWEWKLGNRLYQLQDKHTRYRYAHPTFTRQTHKIQIDMHTQHLQDKHAGYRYAHPNLSQHNN